MQLGPQACAMLLHSHLRLSNKELERPEPMLSRVALRLSTSIAPLFSHSLRMSSPDPARLLKEPRFNHDCNFTRGRYCHIGVGWTLQTGTFKGPKRLQSEDFPRLTAVCLSILYFLVTIGMYLLMQPKPCYPWVKSCLEDRLWGWGGIYLLPSLASDSWNLSVAPDKIAMIEMPLFCFVLSEHRKWGQHRVVTVLRSSTWLCPVF